MALVSRTKDSIWTGKLRHGLLCGAIASNALVSGGVFIFPLISPALAYHLKLTQPQLTTVVLAGMMGQYPLAAVVGNLSDTYGPWLCSLIAAGLFSSGFGLFALEIAKTPDDISVSSHSSFQRLTLYFFMCGMGTVFGLFSALFAATQSYPHFLGIASGTTQSLFGLSPLFISLIASMFFTDPESGLSVIPFMTCLAILTGLVLLCSSLVLNMSLRKPSTSSHIPELPSDGPIPSTSSTTLVGRDASETDALLPKNAPQDIESAELASTERGGPVLELLQDSEFWLLACAVFVITGIGETIMTNIGSIVLSLPSSPDRRTDIAISSQVQAISIANTLTRLILGPLADYVSPVHIGLLNGVRQYRRQPFVSRKIFLTGAALASAAAHLSLGAFIRSQKGLLLLSICTGIAYGGTFVILPSILSGVWGAKNLGRNYGLITYAPFVGTPCFSYLYAFVSERHAAEGVCIGADCWQTTAWVMAGASLVAAMVYGYLWRKWRGLC
ncbi:MFS general substrate transporter [Peniophora sp. CONT]|nr:MFS general substrate transporter [Peniophora sp. CONT]